MSIEYTFGEHIGVMLLPDEKKTIFTPRTSIRFDHKDVDRIDRATTYGIKTCLALAVQQVGNEQEKTSLLIHAVSPSELDDLLQQAKPIWEQHSSTETNVHIGAREMFRHHCGAHIPSYAPIIKTHFPESRIALHVIDSWHPVSITRDAPPTFENVQSVDITECIKRYCTKSGNAVTDYAARAL